MELDERNGDDISSSDRARGFCRSRRAKMRRMKTESTCWIKRGKLGRYVLVHPTDRHLGWSGSRWVPMDDDCFPAGDSQISNFANAADAAVYAGHRFGFIVVGVIGEI